MKKLKVLDLFSGIGGFSLGLERTGGFETVAFCEIEEFPRKVLAKHWPDIPIHGDVKDLKGNEFGPIDLICGGYPCQPFSNAGKRQGEKDDRHLWPEVIRIVATIRPRWCLFENVAGHISMGLDEVLSNLEDEGYTGWPLVIPACAVDAPHRRDRVWIVANTSSGRLSPSIEGQDKQPRRTKVERTSQIDANNDGIQRERECTDSGKSNTGTNGRNNSRRVCENVADSEGQSLGTGLREDEPRGKRWGRSSHSGGEDVTNTKRKHYDNGRFGTSEDGGQQSEPSEICSGKFWLPEPGMGRVANGIPGRVDRLKGLGNAVVPQIPEIIGYAILEAENETKIPDPEAKGGHPF